MSFRQIDFEDGSESRIQIIKEMAPLALQITIAMAAWVVMKTSDTAFLGHVLVNGQPSPAPLEGASVADLYASAAGVFVQGRVLGILAGQAQGAKNYKLIGKWLQVAYVVMMLCAVVVFITWWLTKPVLSALGVENPVLYYAWVYTGILSFALPLRVIASQAQQVLSAQKMMKPSVVGSIAGMSFNLVFGLVLVLGVGVPGWDGFGFIACPIVTVLAEIVQAFVVIYVFVIRKKLYVTWWPGWAPMTHTTRPRVMEFLKLYVPATLSTASDFWRVSAIGAIAGSYGTTEIAVFNSSYRVMWMVLVGASSVASAMSIKLNISLGRGHPTSSKNVTTTGLMLIAFILCITGVCVYMGTLFGVLGSIFSNSPEILEEFKEIALPFSLVCTFMPLSVALERVPLAMGRARLVLFVGLVGSWVLQVPLAYGFPQLLPASFGTPLARLYWGVAAGYLGVCALLLFFILTSNWRRYAEEAVARAEAAENRDDHDLQTGDVPAVGGKTTETS